MQVRCGKRARKWASRLGGGGEEESVKVRSEGWGIGHGLGGTEWCRVSGLRLKILALHFDVWYCVNPP